MLGHYELIFILISLIILTPIKKKKNCQRSKSKFKRIVNGLLNFVC